MRKTAPSRDKISLAVAWPRGASLIVKVHPFEPVKAVLDMVYKDSDFQCYPFVLHEGRLLDLGLSLAFQGVTNNDMIVIHEHAAMKPVVEREFSSFDAKVYSVMLEVMSLHDKAYHHVEGSRRGALVFQKLHQARDDDEWAIRDQPETVVTEKSDVISTEPLPMLLEEEEQPEEDFDNYEVPAFGSIEEAGKFFSKHPFSEWSW